MPPKFCAQPGTKLGCTYQGPGTAGAIARQSIAGGAELILAAGGDGTINEIAEGVAFSDVPLGKT